MGTCPGILPWHAPLEGPREATLDFDPHCLTFMLLGVFLQWRIPRSILGQTEQTAYPRDRC